MKTVLLGAGAALNPGSELWVIPDPQHSRWATKLDWYMNALITRAENRVPQKIPTGLKQILEDEEIEKTVSPNSSGALLFATSDLLPCKWTLLVQFASNIEEWSKKIEDTWTALEKPKIRIFLPASVEPKEFDRFFEVSEDQVETVADLKKDLW